MRKRSSKHFFVEEPEPQRPCEHQGCPQAAVYPAPKDRNHLRDYFWFCLQHVKEYNAQWNYYDRMDDDEIEKSRLFAATWERPTWPLGTMGRPSSGPVFQDPMNLVFNSSPQGPQEASPYPPSSEEGKALALFQITHPITAKQLKNRYKELAKKFHPDVNQGSPQSEDVIKKINLAYGVLKKITTP